MANKSPYSISVLLSFGDDEEIVGLACKRLVDFLDRLDVEFDILAVDDDSGDNSHAVLALMRRSLPDMPIAAAPPGGLASAVRAARGDVIWLLDADAAIGSLAGFRRALGTVVMGVSDAVMIGSRFIVCSRQRCLEELASAPGSVTGRSRSEQRGHAGGAAAKRPRRHRPHGPGEPSGLLDEIHHVVRLAWGRPRRLAS